MAIVAGFVVHRVQITFDGLDTESGEVMRGRIDATPAAVARWGERFAGAEVDVAHPRTPPLPARRLTRAPVQISSTPAPARRSAGGRRKQQRLVSLAERFRPARWRGREDQSAHRQQISASVYRLISEHRSNG
jgi:hypothetical protein